MSAIGNHLKRSNLEGYVRNALDQKQRIGDWPAELKQAYASDRRKDDRDALLAQQAIGCVITLLSCALDLWAIPDQAGKGLLLRLTLVMPIGLALIVLGAKLTVWQLKLGTAFTLTAFAATVTHLASYAEPETAARYMMATSFLLGMGILMLPFRAVELAGFATFFIIVTLLVGFWPNPIAPQMLVENLMITVLVAGGTGILMMRMDGLRHRNFLLKIQDEFTSLAMHENNRALKELSERDALTGLVNRRAFESLFKTGFSEGRLGEEQGISLMMIDLDEFKQLNDEHGHQAGDHALRQVARLLQSAIEPANGIVARYGGEEFIAAFHTASIGEAEQLAEKVRIGISNLEIMTRADRQLHITTSIGVATSGANAKADLAKLTARADRALYAAKRAGRNQVILSERIELRVDRLIE